MPFVFQEWLTHAGINLNVVVDDTSSFIHLAFAMFLAFLSYPAFASSPKHHIPKIDWVFAIVGAGLALYYIFFLMKVWWNVGATCKILSPAV
ncbi:hypothetical protein INT82_01500 [Mannheimia haemolytica]|nr:hypothetical protein [Mannheimia haemolytica]